MKKIGIFFMGILLFFNAITSTALAKEMMVNPFYAISSASEYDKVKDDLNGNTNQMYFQWGRVAMDAEGKMVFTKEFNKPISQQDVNIKYGFPGEDKLKDYKERYPKGKAFLSIFFQTITYEDGKNSGIELLKKSEEEWKAYITNPMIAMMNQYKFDGIVLDFEGFRNAYDSQIYSEKEKNDLKTKYNHFLKVVKESLGEKPLIVCIHPTNVAGYYDGYDYGFINENVDYIILMAYDYQYVTKYDASEKLSGKIKRVDIPQTQPYDKVKESVEKLIKEYKINPNKLIVGLNLTGMKWIKLKKDIDGKTYEYYELGRPYLDGIERLSVKEEYLQDLKISRKVLEGYNILEKDRIEFEKEGAKIEKVEYYYESPTSIYNKYYDIVNHYNLAGVSIWRLGTGSENIWKSLRDIGK